MKKSTLILYLNSYSADKVNINGLGQENISINRIFHGRAVIVDTKALVGSMDLDSYSLTGARIEFGFYTENHKIVRRLKDYFNSVFKSLKDSKKRESSS